MTPHRGDVWLVDFGEPVGREQAGRRPAVVVSDDELNDGPAELAIVIPMTSTRRMLPSHVELDPSESGLDEISYVKCEDVRSVARQRLVARIGRAPTDAIFEIEHILRILLSL